MAGSPVKRQRRAEHEQGQAARARARPSDAATRQWALQRAEQAGDEVAAREAGVDRATIRSWRRRAKADGSLPAPAAAKPGAPPTATPGASSADGTELARAEAELTEVRQARRESLERSRELQKAGNDISAQAAARVARDHATTARALSAEVALLSEAGGRLEAAQAAAMVSTLESFTRAVGVPWSSPVRELLAGLLRRHREDPPDLAPLTARAASEVRQHFSRLLTQETTTAAPERDDDERAPEPATERPSLDTESEPVALDVGEPHERRNGRLPGGVWDYR